MRQRARAWPDWARVALAAVVVIGLGAAVLSWGGGGPAGTAVPPSQDLPVGTTARTADVDVTVHGFRDPQPPGAFLRPRSGTRYVSVDVEVVNRATAAQTFSSLVQIHLLDRTDRQFDVTVGDLDPPAPDGEIAPGAARRGQAVFEVPGGAMGLRVRVQGDLSAPGVVFALG